MSLLFAPVRLGRIELANRMVMAPMTRGSRAIYYKQRATAGMIVTEGVFPAADGKGHVRSPDIETQAQIAGWKAVAESVHDAGGRIVMQLMHMGWISHPSMQPGGALPVAILAIRPAGRAWTDRGQQDFVTPRALTLDGIARIVARYGLDARFGGVKLHGATGYLPEPFLCSGSNARSDASGGSIENRARFLLRVLDAMIAEAGPWRVGLKISPGMNLNDISDANPVATYSHLVSHLPAHDMVYLNVTLFGTPEFARNYLVGGGLSKATAEALLNDRKAAVVLGAAFLANPDLVERFRADAPLNRRNLATAYTPGAKGYTDYPALEG